MLSDIQLLSSDLQSSLLLGPDTASDILLGEHTDFRTRLTKDDILVNKDVSRPHKDVCGTEKDDVYSNLDAASCDNFFIDCM